MSTALSEAESKAIRLGKELSSAESQLHDTQVTLLVPPPLPLPPPPPPSAPHQLHLTLAIPSTHRNCFKRRLGLSWPWGPACAP